MVHDIMDEVENLKVFNTNPSIMMQDIMPHESLVRVSRKAGILSVVPGMHFSM